MKKILFLVITTLILQPLFAAYPVTSPVSVPTPVTEAVKEYKQLSRKEKKERFQKIKDEVRRYKKAGMANETTILLVILAILLPPLAVYLHQDAINNKFWISLILSLLLWVPGVIYSLLVVLDAI